MTFEQGFFIGFVVCQFVFAGIAWKAGVLEALMEYIDEGKKSRRSEVRRVAAQLFAAMHPIDPANASRAILHHRSRQDQDPQERICALGSR